MFLIDRIRKAVLNNKADKAYYDMINGAIVKVNNGDADYIHKAYLAFAINDAKLIEQASKAIGNLLKTYTNVQLLHLDERFRQYSSLEWSIDWSEISIQGIKDHIININDWKYVMILGSFHPNGYYRERCIRELSNHGGTLPYMILRMNDWVEAIRVCALELIKEKVKCCSTDEIFTSLSFLQKVQIAQRRNVSDISNVHSLILEKIEQSIPTIEWFKITLYDFNTRKSIYKILFSTPLLSFEKANQLLERERHSYCKSIIINGILTNYDCPMDELDQYINNKNSGVRINALQYKYKLLKNSWNGIEDLLLDTNHAIRELIIFIIHKHTNINVLQFYIDHLASDNPNMAIIGIGENGDRKCTDLLFPFLNDKSEQTVKNSIQSISILIQSDGYDLYWRYLFDERVSVSKAAYQAIRKNLIHYGASTIYNGFTKCHINHVSRYLLLLLMQEDSWQRLPYLLRLYQYPDSNLRENIRRQIEQRDVYGKVSKQEASDIRSIIKEEKAGFSDKLVREIEFDLKFVEK